ncbi:MAG: HAD family phosphatase [Bacteroidia bacterium]|nr:HAD family phosphatase [Bacteroidia bacterium]
MVEVLKKNVKLLVFDFGGVLIDLYPEKTREEFIKLGIPDPDDLYSPNRQISLFDDFDKGLIKPDDFFCELKKFFPAGTGFDKILHAWNVMLGDISMDKIKLIKKLNETYGVCLLSNTNEPHLEYIHNKIIKEKGIPTMEKIFDKVYYSCRLGMRKPEEKIFRHVMMEWNLSGDEICFLDDTPMHLEGAARLGWHTIKVERNQNWEHLLMQWLNRA